MRMAIASRIVWNGRRAASIMGARILPHAIMTPWRFWTTVPAPMNWMDVAFAVVETNRARAAPTSRLAIMMLKPPSTMAAATTRPLAPRAHAPMTLHLM